MDNTSEEKTDLRPLQVESLGRLMAGFSHDMKNHLGIIRESNGLIGDVVEFGGIQGEEATLQRLKNAVDSIERRVVIAAEMLHHLSSFAHRSDTPLSSFHINDLLVEVRAFLDRFSRLKQVETGFTPGKDIPPIYSSPSLLHHLVYRLYMFCLEHTDAGGALDLETRWKNDRVEICFLLKGVAALQDEAEHPFPPLSSALEELAAAISVDKLDGTDTRITLAVPSLAQNN